MQYTIEHQEIRRTDIGRDASFISLQDFPFGVGRDFKYAKDPAIEQRLLSHIERRGANRNRDRLVGIEGLDQAAAQRRAVVVNYRYRNLADELAEIGLRVEYAVEYRSNDHQAEDPAVGEHAAPFADKRARNAGAVLRQRGIFGTPNSGRQPAQ